jgi:hypothetical protein
MRVRKISMLVLALAALGSAGCATGGAVASGEALNVQFQIDNNLQGIQGVSTYVVTESGQRRSLGPIESNRQATFDRSLRANTYYLVATRVGGNEITSERFRLDTDNITVVWVLGQNQITFRQR